MNKAFSVNASRSYAMVFLTFFQEATDESCFSTKSSPGAHAALGRSLEITHLRQHFFIFDLLVKTLCVVFS